MGWTLTHLLQVSAGRPSLSPLPSPVRTPSVDHRVLAPSFASLQHLQPLYLRQSAGVSSLDLPLRLLAPPLPKELLSGSTGMQTRSLHLLPSCLGQVDQVPSPLVAHSHTGSGQCFPTSNPAESHSALILPRRLIPFCTRLLPRLSQLELSPAPRLHPCAVLSLSVISPLWPR